MGETTNKDQTSLTSLRIPPPSLDDLARSLNDILQERGWGDGSVAIIDRQPNAYESTFPSEIVRCCRTDKTELLLLCKYEAGHLEGHAGHRRGLAYEAEVYRRLLGAVHAQVPYFWGDFIDSSSGQLCLVIEYLEGSQRLNKAVSQPHPMIEAARWLGRFHASTAQLVTETRPSYLITYDHSRYLGYLERTWSFSRHFQEPRISTVCSAFAQDYMPLLLNRAPCVIHGEFYPENVLFHKGDVFPVDWQSAAVAPGEIDFAVLTGGGWPQELVDECELIYQQERWPHGAPTDFAKTLNAARLYWPMLFLGDDRDWLTAEFYESFVWELKMTAERVGLI